ncbi:MAG: serine hydrolase [Parvularculaceae bacterium]|nr:serine hydrolase [Parvularculaceae bacterium]
MKIFALGLATLSALVAWNVFVFFTISEGWLKSPITTSDSSTAFVAALEERVASEHTGNLSMILIERGKVAERYFTSTGDPVDGSSVYQVASLGKWITAWGIMVLVEDGVIELDAPVTEYLTRWQLPEGPYDPAGVTVVCSQFSPPV